MKSQMFQPAVRTPAAPADCPARSAPASFADQIIEGDCAAVLKSFPDACIDLVVTDPPYLVRYRDRTHRTIRNDDNAQVLNAFADVFRVLKPDSFCVSFYGWSAVDTFLAVWRAAGFRPVGHIVWAKNYASRTGYLKATHEQAYLLAKGRPPEPAVPLSDVQPWTYTGNRAHPTEKAVAILRPLVEGFSRPGDLVLDPFAGSGSTAVAAALSGRHYVGIELEDHYCQHARRRLVGVQRYRGEAFPEAA